MDKFSQDVEYYMVNNERVPDSGVGSLITFQAFDQGLLVRSQRLLNSAIQAEEAANVGISSPQPTGYLKNSGADLPDGQIQGLLNTAVGANAMVCTTTGQQNVAIGYFALDDNTTGGCNIAVGGALGISRMVTLQQVTNNSHKDSRNKELDRGH